MLARFILRLKLWLGLSVFPGEAPKLEHVCGLFELEPPHRYVGEWEMWPMDNWGA